MEMDLNPWVLDELWRSYKFWLRVGGLGCSWEWRGWRERRKKRMNEISLLMNLLNGRRRMEGWDWMRLSEWESYEWVETTWRDPKGSLSQITKWSKEWVVWIKELENGEGLSGHPIICGWTQIPLVESVERLWWQGWGAWLSLQGYWR